MSRSPHPTHAPTLAAPPSHGDDLLTTIAFGLAILLPLLGALLGPAAEESAMENRRLAELPSASLDAVQLAAAPAAVEAWYDDRMGFRELLIRAHAWVWIKGLGVSPGQVLAVGDDGWLFKAGPDLVAQYRGADPFTPAELELWRRIFEERHAWLAKRGIRYLVVLVPTKARVYPEHLPGWVAPGDPAPYRQLAQYMADRSQVAVLDLEDALVAGKADRRVFHKTDIHWNDEGGYVGYQAILAALREQLPALAQEEAVAVTRRSETSPGLGLAALFGLEELFEEELLVVEPAEPRKPLSEAEREAIQARRRALRRVELGTGDPRLPVALVFRDSFGAAMMPFLAEHFDRIVFDWTMDVDRALVRGQKPDVVIQEMWAGSIDSPEGRRPREPWKTPSRPWLSD